MTPIACPLPSNKFRFLAALAFATAAISLRASAADSGPVLGLQSWTCRNLTFEQTVAFAVRHHIREVEFTPNHLDPYAPPAETLRKKAYLQSHGVHAYSFGVVRPDDDTAKNRQLFEFARTMGMKLIVVEPTGPAAWDNVEALVKEFDIRVAIHNHNLKTSYGNPATIRKILATRDKRIGVCLDIGWITAAGFDAAEVFRSYGDRVYDMHLKDKVVERDANGKPVAADTEIGKGNADYKGLFAAIRETGWSGVMAIETDSPEFASNPDKFVASAQDFFDSAVSGSLR